ncbi:MAG: NUDIX hydrolase, partial [Nanoarchaeota archaeon]
MIKTLTDLFEQVYFDEESENWEEEEISQEYDNSELEDDETIDRNDNDDEEIADNILNEDFDLQKADINISVKAIITDSKGRYLILKDALSTSKWWDLPGGHMDEQETELQSLSREIKEETQLDLIRANKLFERYLKLGNKNRRVIFFGAEVKGDIKLSEEHADYKWITLNAIPLYNLGVFADVLREYDKLRNLEKGKVAYHAHDSFLDHPVAVKDHQEYFQQSTKD